MRTTEAYQKSAVFAPASVNAGTFTTSTFVDAAGAQEVSFDVITAALGSGKKLTVQLLGSANVSGSSAEVIKEVVFTAGSALTSAVATVSYHPSALNGRYVGIKFKHDADAAVLCAVTAAIHPGMVPVKGNWALEV